MPDFPGFFGGSYPAQVQSLDVERTVNLVLEPSQSAGANGSASFFGTPGFSRWSGTGVVQVGDRGAIVAAGRLFKIIGAGVYEFDVNGTPTLLGTVAQDEHPAQAAYNGVVGGQVVFASGGNAYCLTLSSNALTQVLTGDCTMITYCTGYFLAFNLTTGKVRLSALNDGTTWPGAQFFQRSLFPDPWQCMFVDGNDLVWLVGTESFEVWQNTGVGTQPFAPLSGLYGLQGIAAPFAFTLTPVPCWLMANRLGSGTVVLLAGNAARPLTNYAVANQFSQYARDDGIGDAEMLTYQDGGHTFVTVAFPAAKRTWTADLDSSVWAERGAWNSVTGTFGLWAPRTHVYAFGKHLVGDRTSGSVWQMDTSFVTEMDGTGIRRLRRTPCPTSEYARVPIDRFQLLLDRGLGTVGAPMTSPVATLRVSTDYGQTWGNERQAALGAVGHYGTRVYWNRLGSPEQLCVEVVLSDLTPFRVAGAWLNPGDAESRRVA